MIVNNRVEPFCVNAKSVLKVSFTNIEFKVVNAGELPFAAFILQIFCPLVGAATLVCAIIFAGTIKINKAKRPTTKIGPLRKELTKKLCVAE